MAEETPIASQQQQQVSSQHQQSKEDNGIDDVGVTSPLDTSSQEGVAEIKPQHLLREDDESNEQESDTASQVIHDEEIRLPPLIENQKNNQDAHSKPPDEQNVGEDSTTNEGVDIPQGDIGQKGEHNQENYVSNGLDNGGDMEEQPIQENEKVSVDDDQINSANDGDSHDEVEAGGNRDSTDDAVATDSSNTETAASISNASPQDEQDSSSLDQMPKTTESQGEKQAVEESAFINGDEEEEEDDDDEASLSRVSVDYASKSAGALIIEKSKEFKGTSNLLNNDRDKYAITPCEEKKFVVISLSEDILVKKIKLANFERFSSSVKDFQVLGSQTLGKWFDLGTFTAKAGNGEQTFELLEPAWARYLKFKFLSHHGLEYYCTYSQIKVHGSTMVQGFHEQWEETQEEKEAEYVGSESLSIESTEEPEDEELVPVETGRATTESIFVDSLCRVPLSEEFGNKLCGSQALSDEELLSSLYDLIPSTLNALPKTSRLSPGRRNDNEYPRNIHQTGTSAMQSIYSASSVSKSIGTQSLAAKATAGNITSPRMTDRIGGSLIHYLGTELGLLTSRETRSTRSVPQDRQEAQDREFTDVDANDDDGGARSPESQLLDSSLETAPKIDSDTVGVVIQQPVGGTSDKLIEDKTVDIVGDNTHESTFELDQRLLQMLENLPSAECLSELDFTRFKSNMLAARKPQGAAPHGASSSATPMEPIFKKLTDEIRSLQGNLAVHDQFSKISTACYQRIMTDLIVETQRLRLDHEERLLKLEKRLFSSRGTYAWKVLNSIWGAFVAVVSWVCSTFARIFSPLFLWLLTMAKIGAQIPTLVYRRLISTWPTIKAHFFQNRDGSVPKAARYLEAFTSQLDLLVEQAETADAFLSTGEERLASDDNTETLRLPVVPIIIIVLFGRLIMCFTSPPGGKRVKLPSNSELREWKSKPSFDSTSKERKHQRLHGKPRAYSLGAEPPSDEPPVLISEPSNETHASASQQRAASLEVQTDQLLEKPVVSPISSPATSTLPPLQP